MKKQQRPVLANGLVAGIIGYAVVALFFAFLSLAQGRSVFFTPAMLGGWLFYGFEPPSQTVVAPGPVLAFNGVHLVVFIAFGMLASAAVAITERRPVALFPLVVLAAGLLFVSYVVGHALSVAVAGALPGWSAGAANTIAFGAMGAYLAATHPRLRARLRLYPAGDLERPIGKVVRPGYFTYAAIDALVWSAAWPVVPRKSEEGTGASGSSTREVRIAYCPTLAREVRLVRRRAAYGKARPRAEVVCQDVDEACTGGTCPLFGVPAAVMRERVGR